MTAGGAISPFTIELSSGALAAAVHLPDRIPAPVVVCCHGLFSSKDSAKFIGIGNAFADAGLAVVRFDFSGCGESTASLEKDLLSSRIRDLDSVLEYVRHQTWFKGELGLLGSSLGGYLALLAAASGKIGVKAVVSWAAPFDIEKIDKAMEQSEALRALFPPGFSAGSPKNLRRLPPVPRVLVIHGQKDETVPWEEALDIYRQVGDPKRLLLMETGDHRLLDPHCRELAVSTSLSWFLEHGMS